MGFMFCDLHVSLKYSFLGDINLSNLSCCSAEGGGLELKSDQILLKSLSPRKDESPALLYVA